MGTFLQDGVLPPTKVDDPAQSARLAALDPKFKASAEEWNQLLGAVGDLHTGLCDGTAPVLPSGSTERRPLGDIAADAATAKADSAQALADATSALSAWQAASVTTGMYVDTAAGLAAVAEGAYFNIPSATSGESHILYRKTGGVAVEAKRYPTAAAVDAIRVTAGEQIGNPVSEGTAANGATLITVNGKPRGFTIPAGSTGGNSYVTAFIQPTADEVAKLAGCTIRMKAVAAVPADFMTGKVFSGTVGQANRGAGNVNAGTLARREVVGTQLFLEVTYTVQAADVRFGPTLQLSSGSAAVASAQSFQFTSLTYVVETAAPTTSALTVGDQALEMRLMASRTTAKADILSGAYGATRTVAADGTGDHTTPAAANTAITDASIAKRHKVRVKRGIYAMDDLVPKAFVDFIGDRTAEVVLQMHHADTDATVDINADSCFKQVGTNLLRGLTMTARNARYPLHSEGSGTNVGAVHEVEDCYIRHLGNEGARAYWVSQGQPSTAVWTAAHAIGLGLASGQCYEVRRSTLVSDYASAIGFHNNVDFADPCVVRLEECRLVAHASGGYAVYFSAIGSFKDDVLEIIGCELVGDVVSYPSPWTPTALDKQPANHQEFRVYGRGNSPAVFWTIDFGRALKVESNSASGTSSVAVSGDAVSVLFGREVYAKPGAGGIKGYVYGWADVSGVVAGTSLGQRLGNCTASPKTLTVTVDGGAPVNVVFNADHTAQNNATILGLINSALGSAAVASAYDVGGRYRPHFTDEERMLLNGTAEGFLMGTVLAYDGAANKVRKMTSTDAASLFAGVAWEDIYPGQPGRVKTCGYVHIQDVLRNVSGLLTFGETFSVDATTPGRIVRGGAQGLLRAIRTDAVEVARK